MMLPILRCVRRLCWQMTLLVLLAACSNGRGSLEGPETQPPPSAGAQEGFSIGGTVSGLAGSGLVLQNNGADDLAIAANGSFTFANRLAAGATYDVTVKSHASNPTQVCTVTNAAGTVSGSNVTNVAVVCTSSSFTVGGTVSGLSGSGLILQLNGADDLAIASNGSFTFAAPLESGTQYEVTVSTQPSDPVQICTVAAGSGTVGSANVTSIRVTCAANTFSIGGTVHGLLGSRLVLQNNGGDDLRIDSDGPFTFGTELASGATYDVSVLSQPSDPDQTCTITQGRGAVGSADVTSVVVSCTMSDFTIGGTVRDLAGTGLVLLNNGTDELTINSSGSFTFRTALPTGASYDVTVAEQPTNPSQTCSVSNGSGIVGLSNVTNVTVRCSTVGFLVGGHVERLRGSGLVLQNNGSDDLAIGSNGRFTFSTPLPSGSPYNVTVARQPRDPEQTCTVSDGSGTIESSDIENVEVRCQRDDDDD